MTASRLEARVEPDDADLVVRAPAVGLWTGGPRAGESLGPGSAVGSLLRLNRRFVVVLPREARGVVANRQGTRRVLAVEYGQELFRMSIATGPANVGDLPAARPEGLDDLPAGTHAVIAPTDGVFYRRPSPGADPFVEAGSLVRRGQAVGLVEVMKTFNHIVYGGPGLPEQAEVVEIRCADVEEVRAGQILLLVR